MSTDIERITTTDSEDLDTEIRYAQLLADSTLVPAAYRGRPANIMIATGLGRAMGLSRAESLYRIDVINGKPTAAAELIAANVRRAGHKIRTVVNDREQWAETTIIRSDDPDAPITVRRDMDWARRMELAGKDNYKKQPTTMLQWRSITACARLACPEALYGVAYTPDEMLETGQPPVSRQAPPQRASLAADVHRAPVEGVVVAPEGAPPPSAPDTSRADALAGLFQLMAEAGPSEKAAKIEYMSRVIGREISGSGDLTNDEITAVMDALHVDRAAADTDDDGSKEQ